MALPETRIVWIEEAHERFFGGQDEMLAGEAISDEPRQFFRLLRNAAIQKQRRYCVRRAGKGERERRRAGRRAIQTMAVGEEDSLSAVTNCAVIREEKQKKGEDEDEDEDEETEQKKHVQFSIPSFLSLLLFNCSLIRN
jgi:hypothetical protein